MTTPDTPPPRFEQALAELERILRELEDGTTTLDDALAKYERGVALVRTCYGQLDSAEQRIRLLAGVTDGKPDLKPFEHTATVEKVKKRGNGPPAQSDPY
ncbi:MAG: exodeoxyribonuclease VII small subunit [Gemmataceae bacterium]